MGAARRRIEAEPVSWPALLGRLRRRLAAKGERLRALHSGPGGPRSWLILDARARVLRRDVDPLDLAAELGVLEPWETVVRP